MRRVLFFFSAVSPACGDKDPSSVEDVDDDGDGVALGADCDDGDALVHPGAEEQCNGIDDDCDGPVDEDAVDAIAVFTDADVDGFGDAEAGTACTPQGDQSVVDGDCDDQDPARHPDALEICNGGIDDDCDGQADDADDAARTTAYYSDLDGDGFGGGAPVQSCEPVPDPLEDGTDCDDSNPSIHPGAPELCNDLDDDCDAVTTEADVVSVDGVAYWEIQPAVDAAPDGAVVSICEGTWYENVLIDRDAVLEGRAPELSIIDGSESGSVIYVRTEGISVTLRGLTLQHGTGEDINDYLVAGPVGGGVEATRAAVLTIDDCVIADNIADRGAGVIGPFEGDAIVLDTVIRGNFAAEQGGGALFEWTTDIQGSEITDNTAGCLGGGLAFNERFDLASASLSDTLIDGNVVTNTDTHCTYVGAGGGICSALDLTLTGVTISNNVAHRGGGAYVIRDVTADDKTVVSGNRTDDMGTGGGVAIDSYTDGYYTPDEGATWQYGTIEDNTAGYGGGVALRSGSGSNESELRNATVQANHAIVSGGGVWMGDDNTWVFDSTITSNTSDGVGGGIGTDDTRSTAAALLENVVITSNTATLAGGGARFEMNVESVQCDWGDGATDNSPDDVSLYWDEEEVSYDAFTAYEDFVCTVRDLVCETP